MSTESTMPRLESLVEHYLNEGHSPEEIEKATQKAILKATTLGLPNSREYDATDDTLVIWEDREITKGRYAGLVGNVPGEEDLPEFTHYTVTSGSANSILLSLRLEPEDEWYDHYNKYSTR